MTRLNIALLVLGVLAFAASLLAGRVWLPPHSLLDLIHQPDSLAATIICDIRLPRTVLALVVGAVLGLAGAVLQGFTRNPLAEPALLGVSSGAALGAVIAIYFGLAALSPVAGPLMGMVGALAACALTFALGRGGTPMNKIKCALIGPGNIGTDLLAKLKRSPVLEPVCLLH